MPGIEYTTYSGHANALGATTYVSPRIGEALSLKEAVDAFHAQGALFSINHPVYDVGDLCIGCAWQLAVPPGGVDALEVANGGWDKLGRFFSEGALAYWDWLLSQGHHTAAIGGSDDHRADVDLDFTQSPIGSPTTLVHARELSVEALLEGIRQGRTVVKLRGPEEPMVELTSSRGAREAASAESTSKASTSSSTVRSLGWTKASAAKVKPAGPCTSAPTSTSKACCSPMRSPAASEPGTSTRWAGGWCLSPVPRRKDSRSESRQRACSRGSTTARVSAGPRL